jgi:hypothetical protein
VHVEPRKPGPYRPAAALNLTTSSAGTRPRSLTSMPCVLAHSRTSVVFSPFAGAVRPLRAGRLMPAPTRRKRSGSVREHPGAPERAWCSGRSHSRCRPGQSGRAVSLTAIEVIDEEGLHLLGHSCFIPLLLIHKHRQFGLHRGVTTPMCRLFGVWHNQLGTSASDHAAVRSPQHGDRPCWIG